MCSLNLATLGGQATRRLREASRGPWSPPSSITARGFDQNTQRPLGDFRVVVVGAGECRQDLVLALRRNRPAGLPGYATVSSVDIDPLASDGQHWATCGEEDASAHFDGSAEVRAVLILNADMVVIGPGSVHKQLLPALRDPLLGRAIRLSGAVKACVVKLDGNAPAEPQLQAAARILARVIGDTPCRYLLEARPHLANHDQLARILLNTYADWSRFGARRVIG